MFIETAFPAAFGSAVLVRMTMTDRRDPILLPGIVRWTNESGFGLQFGLLGARETHVIAGIRHVSGSEPASSRSTHPSR
jgi:type IV pilus assembly protein PilZ